MKTQIEGIVLKYFKYKDSSLIAHIYTSMFGRQAFIFRGTKTRNSKRKINYLQPLSLINLSIDYSTKKDMYTGNSAEPNFVPQTIPFCPTKSSIAFFLAELLSKTLYAQERDDGLFNFLKAKIIQLDEEVENINFHLEFLVQLTRYIGIYPESNYSLQNTFFSITQGKFISKQKPDCFNKFNSKLLSYFQKYTEEEEKPLYISGKQRIEFLNSFLQYYNCHVHNFGKLKSLEVLHDVFK